MKAWYSTVQPQSAKVILVSYNLVLHALLLIYDRLNPGVWLNWDRADQRLDAIQALLDAEDAGGFLTALLTRGIPGDFVLQGAIYAIGGPVSVIVFQITLSTVAVAALFGLAMIITERMGIAVAATALYIHFPHTLAAPHFLASEAIYVPLLIISLYYFSCSIADERPTSAMLVAGLVLGIASLIRPITIPWAIVVFALAALYLRQLPPRRWQVYLVASLLPCLMWMLVQLAYTGRFSLGESSHDMNHNLSNRVERMANTMSAADRSRVDERFLTTTSQDGSPVRRETLSVGDYAAFMFSYPLTFAEHLSRDAIVFAGKSGSTRLLFDYFGILTRQEIRTLQRTWRRHWETQGPVATALELFQRHPIVIASITLLSAVGFGIFAVAMFYGTVTLLRREGSRPAERRVVLLAFSLFPVFVFGASQAVNAMQSRHRAPAEFVIAILFCVAVHELSKRRSHSLRTREASQQRMENRG